MRPAPRHTAVWIARLYACERWQHLLTPEDRQQTNPYAAKSAHRRFLLARAPVRLILGAYAEVAPAALNFRYGRYEKPHLNVTPASCRKEAYIKAVGLGLAMPLNRFRVSVERARAEFLEINRRHPHPWRLTRIDAGEGCAAALVTFGDPRVVDIEELS